MSGLGSIRSVRFSAGGIACCFGEDVCRMRESNAARNMAVLRRIALDLARANRSKASLKSKRKCAAWDDRFMTTLIAG